MKKILAIIFLLTLLYTPCLAVDLNLEWDPGEGAAGYKLYMSSDLGVTWSAPVDVGNVLTYTYSGVPDSGLILFRASSYNSSGESIRYEAGVWYNGSWKPPINPGGFGVK